LGIQAEKSGKKGTGARLARFPGCQVVRLARLGSETGHDQPRPPRRLALTVETKKSQIKGAFSKVYFKHEIKSYNEKMQKYNIGYEV